MPAHMQLAAHFRRPGTKKMSKYFSYTKISRLYFSEVSDFFFPALHIIPKSHHRVIFYIGTVIGL